MPDYDAEIARMAWYFKNMLTTKYKILFLTQHELLQMNNEIANFALNIQDILERKLSDGKIILDREEVDNFLSDRKYQKEFIRHIKSRIPKKAGN